MTLWTPTPSWRINSDCWWKRTFGPSRSDFWKHVRFVSQTLKPEQRLILGMVPRTDLKDKALVDFFKELLRLIPPRVKLLIFQGEQDVLAQQTDFSPSKPASPGRTRGSGRCQHNGSYQNLLPGQGYQGNAGSNTGTPEPPGRTCILFRK